MKKFKSTIPNGGLKFFNKFLESELGSEIWNSIEALIAHTTALTEGIVLTGGTVAGVSPAATITESLVILNGKVLRLPATGALTYPFYIAEATTAEINEDYESGASQPTIDNEYAEVLIAPPGSGQYITISAAGEYKSGLSADSVIDQNLGGNIKRVVVEIGDWNMDTSGYVTVTVPQLATPADYKKIVGLYCIIRNDTDTARFPLDTYLTGAAAGAIDTIDTTSGSIGLSRITAGRFDNTSFDSIAYNRGWLLIDYIE